MAWRYSVEEYARQRGTRDQRLSRSSNLSANLVISLVQDGNSIYDFGADAAEELRLQEPEKLSKLKHRGARRRRWEHGNFAHNSSRGRCADRNSGDMNAAEYNEAGPARRTDRQSDRYGAGSMLGRRQILDIYGKDAPELA